MNFDRNKIDSVIFRLFSGTAKYKRSFNYAELVENWEDERPVPTEQEITDTWNEIVAENELKHPYYYKLQNKQWILNTAKKQELKEAIELKYDLETEEKAKKDKNSIIVLIDDSTTEAQFLTLLFEAYKVQALSGKSKKNILDSKTMQEMIDILDNLKK